jgi:hypothetical protein
LTCVNTVSDGIRQLPGRTYDPCNKLLQICVEPWGSGPIYFFMPNLTTASPEHTLPVDAIQKFLADSRLYLAR